MLPSTSDNTFNSWLPSDQWASGSRKIVNKSGLRLHPWRVKRDISKNGDIIPLVKIAALRCEYRTFTHLQKPSPNPNFASAANEKVHSTLSNAFDRVEWG